MVGLALGLLPLESGGLARGHTLCVCPMGGGVRSIRRSLIPCMALGLLLEFVLPTGRPRFLVMGVGSVGRGVRSGAVVGG